MDKATTSASGSLITGLASVARHSFGLLLSRLELAGMELSEVCDHLQKLALVLVLTILTAWFAIAYGTGLVVYLAWECLGWKILLVMGLGFTGLAVGLSLYALVLFRQNKLSLPVTMAEFRADRDVLSKL